MIYDPKVTFLGHVHEHASGQEKVRKLVLSLSNAQEGDVMRGATSYLAAL